MTLLELLLFALVAVFVEAGFVEVAFCGGTRGAATVGNGVMVALEAKSKEQVHKLHEIALANGGTCEGPPGPRGDTFYAAYFRDPDGNKLNAFLMT